MSFIIDHVGLVDCLKNCIKLSSSSTNSYYDDGDNSIKTLRFERRWKNHVMPTLDSALRSARHFLTEGDRHNASRLIACCCIAFCDASILGSWLDEDEIVNDNSEETIISNIQDTMKG